MNILKLSIIAKSMAIAVSKAVITASSPRKARAEIAKATAILAKRDPVLRNIIKQVGPCQLKPKKEYFFILCDSIISQQLSVKVANVILERFTKHLAKSGKHATPEEVLAADTEELRKLGLSYQKIAYLKDLALHFHEKRIVPQAFHKLPDEEIIEELVAVKGIGRWTAEMFLIFSLCRLDVWPVDDLGIKKAVQKAYRLKAMPTAKELLRFEERRDWRPYRSIVSWYLWRTL